MSKAGNRDRLVGVRLTLEEYNRLSADCQKSTCRELSDYIRRMVLSKPVTIKYRNTSLDSLMEEFILLRTELNAIGNNFNQAVKKLHTLEKIAEFRIWLSTNEHTQTLLLQKTEHIKQRISEISDKWLQG